eukprot:m.339031 g.339031  ORF g.339031 m.339031 type:complete len:65 (+) comp20574_c0_seq1:2154-2348(+)
MWTLVTFNALLLAVVALPRASAHRTGCGDEWVSSLLQHVAPHAQIRMRYISKPEEGLVSARVRL